MMGYGGMSPMMGYGGMSHMMMPNMMGMPASPYGTPQGDRPRSAAEMGAQPRTGAPKRPRIADSSSSDN